VIGAAKEKGKGSQTLFNKYIYVVLHVECHHSGQELSSRQRPVLSHSPTCFSDGPVSTPIARAQVGFATVSLAFALACRSCDEPSQYAWCTTHIAMVRMANSNSHSWRFDQGGTRTHVSCQRSIYTEHPAAWLCCVLCCRGWSGLNRGMRLTPELQAQLPDRQQLCVGLGRVTAGRRELFRQQQGMVIEMVQRVFDVVPCNGERCAWFCVSFDGDSCSQACSSCAALASVPVCGCMPH
jgi:hypothetical protein